MMSNLVTRIRANMMENVWRMAISVGVNALDIIRDGEFHCFFSLF